MKDHAKLIEDAAKRCAEAAHIARSDSAHGLERRKSEEAYFSLQAAIRAGVGSARPQTDAQAGEFLILPPRPKAEAPANTVGLDWDAYSGMQMLAYGRACSDAALAAAPAQERIQALELEVRQRSKEIAAQRGGGVAILFEHEDGRYAVNPDTTDDPAWHRLGPVDVSALAFIPARPTSLDTYEGAREDLSIWKRRALESERDLRSEKEITSRLVGEMNAANGPAYMGEPAASQPAYGATEFGWTDYRQLEDGDKRLIALVVSLYGSDHQSSSDLEDLLGRAFNASHKYAKYDASNVSDRSWLEGFIYATHALRMGGQP